MNKSGENLKTLLIGVKTKLKNGEYFIHYSNRIEYFNSRFQLHREDGPAIEYFNSNKIWYINGLKHNDNDCAEIHPDGTKYYYKLGKLHRTDGPAVINYDKLFKRPDPVLEFWLDGVYYDNIKTFEEWIIKQIIE